MYKLEGIGMWMKYMFSKTGGKNFCFQAGEVKVLVLCIDMGKRRVFLVFFMIVVCLFVCFAVHWDIILQCAEKTK